MPATMQTTVGDTRSFGDERRSVVARRREEQGRDCDWLAVGGSLPTEEDCRVGRLVIRRLEGPKGPRARGRMILPTTDLSRGVGSKTVSALALRAATPYEAVSRAATVDGPASHAGTEVWGVEWAGPGRWPSSACSSSDSMRSQSADSARTSWYTWE